MHRMWFVMARRRRLSVVALALLPLAAVSARRGDGSAAAAAVMAMRASGVASVSGRWSGTSEWDHQEGHAVSHVSMSLEQHGRSVTGSLVYTSPAYRGWRGTIDGTVAGAVPDTQFVGTIDLRPPPGAGTEACTGSATFSGSSVSDSLRWETSQLTVRPNAPAPSAACRDVLRNVLLTLERS
jgi:hypothetical protein